MHFKIHRGADEIGGSCVEVWTCSEASSTDTARIVIDMGMPLVNQDRTPFDAREIEKRPASELIRDGILPDIPSLYEDGSKTALLISHAHQDHYGLMNYISPSCPVYLGFPTKLLIELTNTFTGKEWKVQNAHHIKSGKMFEIGKGSGKIKVTPYQMDHAAFDSFAFLIEADGKSLFYSGDFRLHGREFKHFDWFASVFNSRVDYLFLEGSVIGRNEKTFKTEEELEEEFIKTFKETKGINLVFASGQNIDRLKTIYYACKKTGKIFLIDFYVANVLGKLNRSVNSDIPCVTQTFPEMKGYYPTYLIKKMKAKGIDHETLYPFKKIHMISKDDLDKLADKLVMLVRPSIKHDLEKYLHNYTDGCFIYSMFSDYKKIPGPTKDFLDFIYSKGLQVIDIHTSGHADLAGLKKMVEVVKPGCIIPIHTFESKSYPKLFEGVKVRIVKDKEDFAVS